MLLIGTGHLRELSEGKRNRSVQCVVLTRPALCLKCLTDMRLLHAHPSPLPPFPVALQRCSHGLKEHEWGLPNGDFTKRPEGAGRNKDYGLWGGGVKREEIIDMQMCSGVSYPGGKSESPMFP